MLARGKVAEEQQRRHRRHVGFEHIARFDAVDPHHRGRGVAHHTARATAVGGGHDGGEVANVYLVFEHGRGHRAANQGGGDVVEKTGNHKHQHQQHETALPVIGQIVRQHRRHVAVFKMFREQREPEQQAEQVGEGDPFVTQMQQQALDAGARLEARHAEFVERDEEQAAHRDVEGVVVKQRNAEQHTGEENEIERHRTKRDDVGGVAAARCERRSGSQQRHHTQRKDPRKMGSRQTNKLRL